MKRNLYIFISSYDINTFLKKWVGFVYLFNGISTPYEVFNVEIWYIGKCFNIAELKKKRVREIEGEGVVYLFNGISTPYGVFNVEIWYIGKCFNIAELKKWEK